MSDILIRYERIPTGMIVVILTTTATTSSSSNRRGNSDNRYPESTSVSSV